MSESKNGAADKPQRAEDAPVAVSRARRPVSYAGAPDTEPCEGMAAPGLPSPSNPTHAVNPSTAALAVAGDEAPARKAKTVRQSRSTRGDAGDGGSEAPRDATVVFRCTRAEKRALKAAAKVYGVPFSELLREALKLPRLSRHKPHPKADPELVRTLGRIGVSLGDMAQTLTIMRQSRLYDRSALIKVAAGIVAFDRAIGESLKRGSELPAGEGAAGDTGRERHSGYGSNGEDGAHDDDIADHHLHRSADRHAYHTADAVEYVEEDDDAPADADNEIGAADEEPGTPC